MTKETINQGRNLFDDIDTKLLIGIQCSGNNFSQQNYLERLKVQTETAFVNKKFKKF
tara:strand:+ start:286 stop:456 length:171 start_codon:yes stop_codon:yes gene_type:complete